MDSVKLPMMRKVEPQLIHSDYITSIRPMKYRGNRKMREVVVEKEKLLEILKKNRESHAEDYKKALEGYYIECIERLKEALEIAEAKTGAVPNRHLPMPEEHTDDYDRIIGMFEMHIDDEVTITEQEYSNFVDDDWDWKRQWYNPAGSNTLYMSKVS